MPTRISEVLAALSLALDLGDERPAGHALRTCLIGLEIGARLGLPLRDLRDLYYASLLKDAGGSSRSAARLRMPSRLNSAAAADLESLRVCRGAEIVETMGLGGGVTCAVRSVGERWDGAGHSQRLRGQEIPTIARVIAVAQGLDAFGGPRGSDLAFEVLRARRGKWFDPTLCDAASDLGGTLARLARETPGALYAEVLAQEPGGASVLAGPGSLERIGSGFATIVDALSPFMAGHGLRVADLAAEVAKRCGVHGPALAELRLAALFHDLGKLAAPNAILDKPGPLSSAEERLLREHTVLTRGILSVVPGLARIAEAAGSHHERLDGSGYDRGLAGDAIPFAARAIAVADVFDALSNARPYRPALPEDMALRIMERERGPLDPACMDALTDIVNRVAPSRDEAMPDEDEARAA